MESRREIKRRLGALQDIEHVTRAMKMISVAKLQRLRRRWEAAGPYAARIRALLARITALEREGHPLLAGGKALKDLYVVVTADHGLGGGYNANVLRLAVTRLKENPTAEVVAIGSQGGTYFSGAGYTLRKQYPGVTDDLKYGQVRAIAAEIWSWVEAGSYREVYLVFTRFLTAVNVKPAVIRLFPPDLEQDRKEDENLLFYLYEPDRGEILDHLLPRSLEALLYYYLLEAKAAEHAARVAAMDAASENAEELQEKLLRVYHRLRKEEITGELNEMMAAAQVIKGEIGDDR